MDLKQLKQQRVIINQIITDHNNGILSYDSGYIYRRVLGIILQTIMSFTYSELTKYIKQQRHSKYYFKDASGWQSSPYNFTQQIKLFWLPLMEKPEGPILQYLHKYGFNRETITNLDRFNGDRILKHIDLYEEKDVYEDVYDVKLIEQFKTLEYDKIVPRSDWWGRLWGFTELKVITVTAPDGFKEEKVKSKKKIGTEKKPIVLSTKKVEHLIIYLNAYLKYLDDLEVELKKR